MPPQSSTRQNQKSSTSCNAGARKRHLDGAGDAMPGCLHEDTETTRILHSLPQRVHFENTSWIARASQVGSWGTPPQPSIQEVMLRHGSCVESMWIQ